MALCCFQPLYRTAISVPTKGWPGGTRLLATGTSACFPVRASQSLRETTDSGSAASRMASMPFFHTCRLGPNTLSARSDLHIEGTGPETIVMIHGWPDTYRLWDKQVEHLKDRYRCIRFT